jgi:hypothetical protein
MSVASLEIDSTPMTDVRYGTVRYGTVRYGTVRYGTVRYGTVRYGTVRYGTVRRISRKRIALRTRGLQFTYAKANLNSESQFQQSHEDRKRLRAHTFCSHQRLCPKPVHSIQAMATGDSCCGPALETIMLRHYVFEGWRAAGSRV